MIASKVNPLHCGQGLRRSTTAVPACRADMARAARRQATATESM